MSSDRWKTAAFHEVVEDASRGHTKIKRGDYLDQGPLPVVDQGQGLIGGFTDDVAAASHVDSPVVVFGDHTRALKYVDFPFAVGADGVKVLKPSPVLEPRFFFRYLQTVQITDAGYSRHFKYLKQTTVPVPPIEEQRRIVAVLDAVDDLRAMRREAFAKLNALTQAIFIDMFGSPGANPLGWPVRPLSELVDPHRPITYGILKPGDHVADGVPYVRVVDMDSGRVIHQGLRRTTSEIADRYKRSTLEAGDLLISIRGHVGRMARVDAGLAGANITQDTARLAVASANSTYVMVCLELEESQRWMANFTKGAAVRGLNLTDLKQLPVPVPPAQLQLRFAERADEIYAKLRDSGKSAGQLDELFASIQQRAFRGEL